VKLSIVIPFRNEEKNVAPVITEVQRFHPEAEIIAVDDGSTDGTAAELGRIDGIVTLRLARHGGQSAALYAGLRRARGDVCVTMDGDGQTSTSDIKRLLGYLPEYDFVNGHRTHRSDARSRVVASRLANWLRNLFTGDGMRDTGGSPKAMKRECIEHLVPFDAMHRFIPALLVRAGFKSIEIPVEHRARLHGRTNYTNWGRALRGAWDLVGIRWLLSRRLDPRDLESEASPDRDTPHGVP
jgi:dolichol-phosphate mannosyltransferase